MFKVYLFISNKCVFHKNQTTILYHLQEHKKVAYYTRALTNRNETTLKIEQHNSIIINQNNNNFSIRVASAEWYWSAQLSHFSDAAGVSWGVSTWVSGLGETHTYSAVQYDSSNKEKLPHIQPRYASGAEGKLLHLLCDSELSSHTCLSESSWRQDWDYMDFNLSSPDFSSLSSHNPRVMHGYLLPLLPASAQKSLSCFWIKTASLSKICGVGSRFVCIEWFKQLNVWLFL